MPSDERFITENIGNVCGAVIWLRKQNRSMCDASVFTKNVNFLHYCPDYVEIVDDGEREVCYS